MNNDEIKDAIKSKCWRDVDADTRKRYMMQALTNAYLSKSMEFPNNSAVGTFIVDDMYNHITKQYALIHLQELNVAFQAGVRGELATKDTYLCNANFQNWLRAYYTSPERQAVIDELFQASKPLEADTRDIEKLNEQAYDDGIHMGFAYFKQSGGRIISDEKGGLHLPQWASQIYDYYHCKGMIPDATEDDKKIAVQYADKMHLLRSAKIGGMAINVQYEDWFKTGLLGCYFSRIAQIPILL